MKPRRLDVSASPFPAYVVWELTLACDHACTHCGSRAGRKRKREGQSDEMTTSEALDFVNQLKTMKTREVILIGGEAYLHEGFLDVVKALHQAEIRVGMTTGGYGVTAQLAQDMAQAGMYQVSVSIDGMEEAHDRMRSRKGSFAAATAALGHIVAAGMGLCANTNLNRLNQADLEDLYQHLVACEVQAWQLQLTAALGRAADRPEMLLQPYELGELLPQIATLKTRGLQEGMTIMPGNNLGYFGPEEALLRSPRAGMRDHWAGCQAGRFVMGVESNGAIKGCPSLQPAYITGHLRDHSLEKLWQSEKITELRKRTSNELWGFCKTCPFAKTCRAGCTFHSHALFGRAGNNPYCHYRVRRLAEQGKRERVEAVESAPGLPFDNGRFVLIVEEWDAPLPAPLPPQDLVRIRRRS